CGSRNLRPDVLRRRATHAGDRNPDGAGSGPGENHETGPGAGYASGHGWNCYRFSRSVWPDAAAGEIPVWRETERPAGIFNRRSDSDCGHFIGCLRSYQKGNARGPDGGPSTRIGRFLRHSNLFLHLHNNSRMANRTGFWETNVVADVRVFWQSPRSWKLSFRACHWWNR